MTFSLLESPFAVLGVSPLDSLDVLRERAEAVGTPAAQAALRTLSLPRTRLEAEVAFLPGSAAAAARVLGALAAEPPRPLPEEGLTPLATANVLAHLCGAGDDRAAALLHVHASVGPAGVVADVAREREGSGFPAPQLPAVEAALGALLDRHAGALLAAVRLDADLPARLGALVWDTAPGPPLALARRAAAAWARESAAELSSLEEEARTAAERLREQAGRDGGGEAPARALAGTIRAWTALTRPQRASDQRAGLEHEASARQARSWRRLGLELAEEARPDLSLIIAQALAEGLGDLPELGPQLREDVAACERLRQEAALAPILAPLRGAVAAAASDPKALARDLLRRGFGTKAVGQAAPLWSAFLAAAEAAGGVDAPWRAVRGLAVGLHNEHDQTDAALAITTGMQEHARAIGAQPILDWLRVDERALRRARVGSLANAGKRWAARRELARLLPLAEDAAQRHDFEQLRDRLGLRLFGAAAPSGRRSAWLAIVVVIAVVRIVASLDGPPRPGSASSPFPIPSVSPVLLGASTPREVRPSREQGSLQLEMLRWCRFTDIRLEAARPTASSRAANARFNELVDEYNEVCARYRFQQADMRTVDAEVAQWRSALEEQGRAMLSAAGVAAAPVPPGLPGTPSAPGVTPVAPVPLLRPMPFPGTSAPLPDQGGGRPSSGKPSTGKPPPLGQDDAGTGARKR